METLVLNAAYQPINRVAWQIAFGMVFTGRAELVEPYEDRLVRSVREAFPMPSIIRCARMATYVFQRGVRFNRRNVYLRDKGLCQYCGHQVTLRDFSFEHVVPRSQGGETSWDNIVVACVRCNRRKGGRTPVEAGMRLLSRPVRPRTLPGVGPGRLVWEEGMPPSWKDYLHSYRYWHTKLKA